MAILMVVTCISFLFKITVNYYLQTLLFDEITIHNTSHYVRSEESNSFIG